MLRQPYYLAVLLEFISFNARMTEELCQNVELNFYSSPGD